MMIIIIITLFKFVFLHEYLNVLYFIVDKVTSKNFVVRFNTLSQEPKYFLVPDNSN
jgi:hypothetical protein